MPTQKAFEKAIKDNREGIELLRIISGRGDMDPKPAEDAAFLAMHLNYKGNWEFRAFSDEQINLMREMRKHSAVLQHYSNSPWDRLRGEKIFAQWPLKSYLPEMEKLQKLTRDYWRAREKAGSTLGTTKLVLGVKPAEALAVKYEGMTAWRTTAGTIAAETQSFTNLTNELEEMRKKPNSIISKQIQVSNNVNITFETEICRYYLDEAKVLPRLKEILQLANKRGANISSAVVTSTFRTFDKQIALMEPIIQANKGGTTYPSHQSNYNTILSKTRNVNAALKALKSSVSNELLNTNSTGLPHVRPYMCVVDIKPFRNDADEILGNLIDEIKGKSIGGVVLLGARSLRFNPNKGENAHHLVLEGINFINTNKNLEQLTKTYGY